MILPYLVSCRRMSTGEMVRYRVMLKEHWLKMCYWVIIAEDAPHLCCAFLVKLRLLQFVKFINQSIVYDKVLLAVSTRGFILMLTLS